MFANAQEAERGQAVSRRLESRLEGQPLVPGATFQAPLDNASSNDSVGASASYLIDAHQENGTSVGGTNGRNRFSQFVGQPIGYLVGK